MIRITKEQFAKIFVRGISTLLRRQDYEALQKLGEKAEEKMCAHAKSDPHMQYSEAEL